MTSEGPIDRARLREKQKLIGGYSAGLAVSAMIYLGDRLGLYAALAAAGPATSAELAAATGLQERWLREWLRAQAAAGVLEYPGDGRFELSPEVARMLLDESTPASIIGSFDGLPGRMALLPRIAEAFSTGIGLTFDDRGPEAVRTVERQLGPTHRALLVSTFLPALDGVVGRLSTGARVADVGCGTGLALVEMARAFPRSRVSRVRHLGPGASPGGRERRCSGHQQRHLPPGRARPPAHDATL